MKTPNGMEGSVDELLKFCELSKIDVASLVNGKRMTDVKWWHILISGLLYVLFLILQCCNFDSTVTHTIFKILTLFSAIATLALFPLRCDNNKAWWTVCFGLIITYLIATNVYTPEDIVNKAQVIYEHSKQ